MVPTYRVVVKTKVVGTREKTYSCWAQSESSININYYYYILFLCLLLILLLFTTGPCSYVTLYQTIFVHPHLCISMRILAIVNEHGEIRKGLPSRTYNNEV